MNPYIAIIVPIVIWVTALAAFAIGLVSALIFIVCIATGCVFAVRFNERHTHAQYDDRLTGEKIEKAIESYIEEVKKRE